MKEVRIDKGKLLGVIKANRARHREIFLDALEGYRKKVVEELQRALDEAKKGVRFATSIYLQQPIDQTREYDAVIRMLDMSTDDVITLTQQEFACYVLDQWSWQGQFVSSNSRYLTSSRARLEEYAGGSNDAD